MSYPPASASLRLAESLRIARRVVWDVKGHGIDGTLEHDKWVNEIATAIRNAWEGIEPFPAPFTGANPPSRVNATCDI